MGKAADVEKQPLVAGELELSPSPSVRSALLPGSIYCCISVCMVSHRVASYRAAQQGRVSSCRKRLSRRGMPHLHCPTSLQILLNKMALSSFNFSSANALLALQCLFCVLAVLACSALGLIRTEVR